MLDSATLSQGPSNRESTNPMEKTTPKKKGLGVAIGVVLAAILVVGGFALTDQITVPTTSHAGEGHANVVKMTVTNVDYKLNATNPSLIDEITFDLGAASPLPSTAELFIEPYTGEWYSCNISVPAKPVCDTSTSGSGGHDLTATEVTQVRVVAAD